MSNSREKAAQTRQHNSALRAADNARRECIQQQVADILRVVSAADNLSAEQRVRLAELAVELYRRF